MVSSCTWSSYRNLGAYYSFMIVQVENNTYTLLPYKASIEQLENFFTEFPKGIRGTFKEMKCICKNVL